MSENRLTPWLPALDGTRSPDTTNGPGDLVFRLDVSEVETLETSPSGRPLAVRLPEPYEPNYAYPLVVWLHGRGGSHADVAAVAERVGEQNFVFLGVDGTRPVLDGVGRDWHADDLVDWLPELHETLCNVRRRYHVHSERILLAGEGTGATTALQLLLRRPEWFAGAVSWNGELPERELSRFRDLKGKRVLLATGTEQGIVPAVHAAAAAKVLRTAGLDVTQRTYDSAGGVPAEMLREANAWLLETACAVV